MQVGIEIDGNNVSPDVHVESDIVFHDLLPFQGRITISRDHRSISSVVFVISGIDETGQCLIGREIGRTRTSDWSSDFQIAYSCPEIFLIDIPGCSDRPERGETGIAAVDARSVCTVREIQNITVVPVQVYITEKADQSLFVKGAGRAGTFPELLGERRMCQFVVQETGGRIAVGCGIFSAEFGPYT